MYVYIIMSSANSLGEADYPIPIGVMTFWCGDTNGIVQPPTGWLICDGSEQLVADYPLLYNILGDEFGTPSDADHFLLPSTIGGTATQSDGKLPLYKSVNTGTVDAGAAGTANLSFTLAEANMPSLPTYDGTTGIQATNTVWTSSVNSARNVADNDTSGGSSNTSNTTRHYVPYNTPVAGINKITPTQTNPNMLTRQTAPTAYTGVINLDGEVPKRYEMPIIIKAGYAF
jgi:microcystin-dependent protein